METMTLPRLTAVLVAEEAPRATAFPITLAEGLIGCEAWQRFELEAPPEAAPLMFLHSLDQPELSFIVTEPQRLLPDYCARLSEADLQALGQPGENELALVVILNVGAGPQSDTVKANLLGPVAINLASGAARQVIQPEYSAYHLVGPMPTC